jgi:hypothetical protein
VAVVEAVLEEAVAVVLASVQGAVVLASVQEEGALASVQEEAVAVDSEEATAVALAPGQEQGLVLAPEQGAMELA